MPSAKLSVVSALLLAAAALLAGCSTKPVDPTAKMTPEQIHEMAREEIFNLQYAKGIELLEKLEGRAAGTPLAQQAQLEKAHAHYKNEEPAQAVATLDRFIRLHPASPAIDYALYLKGMVSFNEDLGLFSRITQQDLSERDQQAAKESFAAFKELVTRFPHSRYAADASARMTYIVNSLAKYEVHVARYYYSRGAYLATINRAQQAIADYRDAPALEEALYLMVQSYDALQMPQLRDDARRVLQSNYPQSRYIGGSGGDTTTVRQGPWWKLW
ncbi:outer membrane protein assembly factor BamD [Rhodoferax sp. BAB1]|uniref:outer membrane protein assembly factor BamD n=1 Tax=Rhodoferax sp. BAB1 TaxID=2741720 RepID=UPI001576E84B|nr:outer membrane protein assembly factor BamD [Rhodoferax sp. BAB1]QKO21957.1 outer membrane protein assembly factor BamD [Rhodoferax sp. BAB1]